MYIIRYLHLKELKFLVANAPKTLGLFNYVEETLQRLY